MISVLGQLFAYSACRVLSVASVGEADLISQTAKLLGYARVTKKIDVAVTQAIDALKVSNRIQEENGLVRAA